MDETEKKVIDMLIGVLTNQRKDSITIGSASKGGEIKVYFDAGNMEEAKERIDKAMEVRSYAQGKML